MIAAVSAGFQDFTDLIAAIAWPLTLIIVVVIFQAPLRALLRRENVELRGPGGWGVSAKGQEIAANALVEASASRGGRFRERAAAETGVDAVAREVEALGRAPQVLWVDDHPSHNRQEVAALTSLGMHVHLSPSTEDAVNQIWAHGRYDVIISDMGRPPDTQAGYTLLDALRSRGDSTPFVIYSSTRAPEYFDLAVRRGAAGCTNQPDELIDMVTNALRDATSRAADTR